MPNQLTPAYERPLDDYPTAMGCSRDGQQLAVATAAGTLTLLDPSTGDVLAEVPSAHSGAVLQMAWGKQFLATCGEDGMLKLWQPRTLNPIASFSTGKGWASQLAVTADGKRLAVASGKQMWVVDDRGQASEAFVATAGINALSFNAVGGLIGVAAGAGLHIVNANTLKEDRRLGWHSTLLNTQFSPDGKVIAAGGLDKAVHFWRTGAWTDSQMSGYLTKPTVMAFSPDSKLLATNGDEPVIVWNFAGKGPEGVPPIQLSAHLKPVKALVWHPKQPWLSSGAEDGSVALWNPKAQTQPLGLALLKQECTALSFCASAPLLFVGGADGRLFAFWCS